MTKPDSSYPEDEKLERLPLVPLSEAPTQSYVPKYDFVAEFARQIRPGFNKRAFVEKLGLDYDEMQAAFRRVRPEPLPSHDEVSEGFENSKVAAERLTVFFSQGVSPEVAAENEAKYRAAMKGLGLDPLKGKISFGAEAVSDELGKAAGTIGEQVEEEITQLLSNANNPMGKSPDRRRKVDPKRLKEISEAAAEKLREKGIDPDELKDFLLNNSAKDPDKSFEGMRDNPAIIAALLGGLGDAIAKAEGWDEEIKDSEEGE